MLGIETGAAGWEASMLPLCYEAYSIIIVLLFSFSGCLSDVREDIGAGQGRAEGPEDQTGGLLPEEPFRACRAGAEAFQSPCTTAEGNLRDLESWPVKWRLLSPSKRWFGPLRSFQLMLTDGSMWATLHWPFWVNLSYQSHLSMFASSCCERPVMKIYTFVVFVIQSRLDTKLLLLFFCRGYFVQYFSSKIIFYILLWMAFLHLKQQSRKLQLSFQDAKIMSLVISFQHST